jgi:ATP-binding cassette, subfamily B, multidrug efflux pump
MKSLFALNKYLWRYKKLLILGVFFVIASNIFTIYPAQIIRTAMDMIGAILNIYHLVKGFGVAAKLSTLISHSLWLFGGLLILLAIFRGVFLFYTRQTIIVASRLIEYDLRKDIYEHFQKLTLTFYRKNRTGDLMARISEDVNRVRMYLGPAILYAINTLTLFVLLVSVMFMVSWKLALVSLIPLPFLSYAIYRVESVIEGRTSRLQAQLSVLNTFVQEMYSGIRVIKAYVKEPESEKKFEKEAETYKDRAMHLAKVDAMFFPTVMFLVGLSAVLTIWVGGELVIIGELTIGNIAEFILYLNLLTWPIIALGWLTTLTQQAAASQARINELMKEEPEITFPQTIQFVPKSNDIEFKNVSFTYSDTSINALKKVSFKLESGKKMGIIGHAGSGKSTLAHLILRLMDINEGEILLGDIPIKELTKGQVRGIMGYAPQDVFLFSDSIHENIAFGKPDATRAEVEFAAKQAVVYDNIIDFPEGFETVIGERGVNLSGGQKQRISIARAWVKSPQILLLDDVLSAVDTQTEESILQNIKTFRHKNPATSIIQIAHRISCVQDSDFIIVLENGAMIEAGTHESLLEAKGYYSRIYEKQLSERESVQN